MKSRAPGNRIEQESLRRRSRAHAHLNRMRDREQQQSGPGRRPLFGALALLAAGSLGAVQGDAILAELGDPGWRVTQVEVLGAERLAGRELADAAGLTLGLDYDGAEPERVVAALGEHAWVAEARAKRLPGGTVVLEVRERQALVVIEGGGGPLGVDAEGRPFAVLEADEAESLPRLRAASAPAPGQTDPDLAEAIRVARSLPEQGVAMPTEIELGEANDPEGLVLRLPGYDARFVLGRDDLEARIASLAELLAHRAAEVAEAAQVDLRFAGQAVLQPKAESGGSA
ncbi:MAG: hypothetical protein AAF430_03460 [Myxococcota bacterium]